MKKAKKRKAFLGFTNAMTEMRNVVYDHFAIKLKIAYSDHFSKRFHSFITCEFVLFHIKTYKFKLKKNSTKIKNLNKSDQPKFLLRKFRFNH